MAQPCRRATAPHGLREARWEVVHDVLQPTALEASQLAAERGIADLLHLLAGLQDAHRRPRQRTTFPTLPPKLLVERGLVAWLLKHVKRVVLVVEWLVAVQE